MHVYCTDCVNIYSILYCIEKARHTNKKDCSRCPCKGCDCFDFEDSVPNEERPNYIKNKGGL